MPDLIRHPEGTDLEIPNAFGIRDWIPASAGMTTFWKITVLYTDVV
jgi:hypothetical protein